MSKVKLSENLEKNKIYTKVHNLRREIKCFNYKIKNIPNYNFIYYKNKEFIQLGFLKITKESNIDIGYIVLDKEKITFIDSDEHYLNLEDELYEMLKKHNYTQEEIL